jgi:polyisoprenoid-binding protein YceI
MAIAGALAWYTFGGDAPAKPRLPSSAATPTGPIAGRWTVQRGAQSWVGYRIDELFAGETLRRAAVGRTHTVEGTMTMSSNAVTAAQITADMRVLTSDRVARDTAMATLGLETNRFPDARFRLDTPIPLPGNAASGAPVTLLAHGSLTLHGVTRTVSITLHARRDGNAIVVAATAPIQLRDWAIAPPRTVIVDVDDHGALELQLRFVHA